LGIVSVADGLTVGIDVLRRPAQRVVGGLLLGPVGVSDRQQVILGIIGVAGRVALGVGVTGQVVIGVIGEGGCQAEGVGRARGVPLDIVGGGFRDAPWADDLGQIQIIVVVVAGHVTERVDGLGSGAVEVEVDGSLVSVGVGRDVTAGVEVGPGLIFLAAVAV